MWIIIIGAALAAVLSALYTINSPRRLPRHSLKMSVLVGWAIYDPYTGPTCSVRCCPHNHRGKFRKAVPRTFTEARKVYVGEACYDCGLIFNETRTA